MGTCFKTSPKIMKKRSIKLGQYNPSLCKPRKPTMIKEDVIYTLFKDKAFPAAAKLTVLACATSEVGALV